tara:strand:+ start:743 stop:1654 length:912 start_codon:yes stop_codon:yes gene_type:complete
MPDLLEALSGSPDAPGLSLNEPDEVLLARALAAQGAAEGKGGHFVEKYSTQGPEDEAKKKRTLNAYNSAKRETNMTVGLVKEVTILKELDPTSGSGIHAGDDAIQKRKPAVASQWGDGWEDGVDVEENTVAALMLEKRRKEAAEAAKRGDALGEGGSAKESGAATGAAAAPGSAVASANSGGPYQADAQEEKHKGEDVRPRWLLGDLWSRWRAFLSGRFRRSRRDALTNPSPFLGDRSALCHPLRDFTVKTALLNSHPRRKLVFLLVFLPARACPRPWLRVADDPQRYEPQQEHAVAVGQEPL